MGHSGNHPGMLYEQELKETCFTWKEGASSHPCAPAYETRLDLRNQTNRTASKWRRRRQELRRPQGRTLPSEPPDPSSLEEDRPGGECFRSERPGRTELRGKDHGMLSRDAHSGRSLRANLDRSPAASAHRQLLPAISLPTTASALHQRDTEFSKDTTPHASPDRLGQSQVCGHRRQRALQTTGLAMSGRLSPPKPGSSLTHGISRKMCLVTPRKPVQFPDGSDGKESACNAGDPGSIPGREDALEKGMAAPSSILSWKIPWTEEPGGLQSVQPQRVGTAETNTWQEKRCCFLQTLF